MIAKIFASADEFPGDSPLEFLDQRMDDPAELRKLVAEAAGITNAEVKEASTEKSNEKSRENDLEKAVNADIINPTPTQAEKGENNHAKGNNSQLERN